LLSGLRLAYVLGFSCPSFVFIDIPASFVLFFLETPHCLLRHFGLVVRILRRPVPAVAGRWSTPSPAALPPGVIRQSGRRRRATGRRAPALSVRLCPFLRILNAFSASFRVRFFDTFVECKELAEFVPYNLTSFFNFLPIPRRILKSLSFRPRHRGRGISIWKPRSQIPRSLASWNERPCGIVLWGEQPLP
jgi:hypothetical protein